jgi:hypothetical protein
MKVFCNQLAIETPNGRRDQMSVGESSTQDRSGPEVFHIESLGLTIAPFSCWSDLLDETGSTTPTVPSIRRWVDRDASRRAEVIERSGISYTMLSGW